MARPAALHSRLASWALLVMLLSAGCAPTVASTAVPTIAATRSPLASATPVPTGTSTLAATQQASQGEIPVTSADVLYQDNFTNSASGWPEEKFDNYFVGYHEPTYYHVEIDSANYHATVFVPGKKSFGDATIQVTAHVVPDKTAASGDFAYGIAFRRSGDNYYAFVVSPRSQKWLVLKSSPNALAVLAQGADTSLHAANVDDLLRVDVQGSTFSLHINGRLVAQVSDKDYASGEVGFYVQTYDSQQVHIHYDDIVVQKYEAPQPPEPQGAVLYQDDFTDSTSGWPEAKFDNYFVGYHEPTYYHVEIDSPNYHATVFVPGKKIFDDTTIQVSAHVVPDKTAASGDFVYGIAFRRSGDNYYAFVVSPRSQKWLLLKSSPNTLSVLAQGADTSLHAADVDDLLRVDAQGSTFSLHINGRLVAEVSDKDYASGEVGFYVQTYDSQQVHIHFDDLLISAFSAPSLCKVQGTKNGINMRGGPGYGTNYLASLPLDEALEPLGQSLDGSWLYVRVERSGALGWVPSANQLVACNLDVSTLPIIVP